MHPDGVRRQKLSDFTKLLSTSAQTPPDTGPDTPLGPDLPGSDPLRTRHPPLEQTPPPGADTPPGKQTPAYGQRAAATHPTGMHSCFRNRNPCLIFHRSSKSSGNPTVRVHCTKRKSILSIHRVPIRSLY